MLDLISSATRPHARPASNPLKPGTMLGNEAGQDDRVFSWLAQLPARVLRASLASADSGLLSPLPF